MQVRRLALVLGTVLSLMVGTPQISEAKAIFNFSGSGDDGGVVWDGDADVGSMNNSQCGPANPNSVPEPTVTNCNTDVFSFPAQDLRNLQVTLSGLTRDQFDGLFIGFTVSDCTAFSSLLSADILCDAYDTLQITNKLNQIEKVVSNPRFSDMNGDFTDPNLISILALAVGGNSGSGPFGLAASIITLLDNSTLKQSDLDGLHFGILANASVGETAFSVDASLVRAAAPVPEPTSMLLLGTGLAGAVARRYRRRSAQS